MSVFRRLGLGQADLPEPAAKPLFYSISRDV